jgi:hypothetical protein
MLCVRPGVFEVRARAFRSNNELISDDLPTFDRPKNAISGRPSLGHCRASKALFINWAELIFTVTLLVVEMTECVPNESENQVSRT